MSRRLLASLVAVLSSLVVLCAPAGALAQDPVDDGPGEGQDAGWPQDNPPAGEDAEDDPSGEDDAGAPTADEDGSGGDDSGEQPWPQPALDDPLEPLDPVLPEIEVPTTKTIAGKVALVRADGKAAIPRGAPKRVRQLIAAANQIVGKPYKWGGGHAKLVDRGYDCSGTVSYALIRTGLLRAPRTSGGLTRWGAAGAGRWVSVYANAGHVYLEVAGLRLDTSPVGDRGGRSGPRWRPLVGKRRGFKSRHPVGL